MVLILEYSFAFVVWSGLAAAQAAAEQGYSERICTGPDLQV